MIIFCVRIFRCQQLASVVLLTSSCLPPSLPSFFPPPRRLGPFQCYHHHPFYVLLRAAVNMNIWIMSLISMFPPLGAGERLPACMRRRHAAATFGRERREGRRERERGRERELSACYFAPRRAIPRLPSSATDGRSVCRSDQLYVRASFTRTPSKSTHLPNSQPASQSRSYSSCCIFAPNRRTRIVSWAACLSACLPAFLRRALSVHLPSPAPPPAAFDVVAAAAIVEGQRRSAAARAAKESIQPVVCSISAAAPRPRSRR